MLSRLPLACVVFLSAALARAEEAAHPRQLSFFVSGVECPSCVYVIQQALTETKGVSEAEVIQMSESEAKVSFDPAIASEHQLAQALREALALHGVPYLATLKVRIPGYSREAHASKLAVVFARWQESVKIEPLDGHEGTFVIRFLPLETDARKSGPQGWSLGQLAQAITAPAPKGLGLTFEVIRPQP
jgi:copper chaperone CopZ